MRQRLESLLLASRYGDHELLGREQRGEDKLYSIGMLVGQVEDASPKAVLT